MNKPTWKTIILGSPGIAKISSGGTPTRKNLEFFDGNIPWVKSGDLNDSILQATKEHISEAGLTSSAARILPPGTVLVAMYGATVGKTAVLGVPAATNQAVCSIQPSKEAFNKRFLQFLLMHLRPVLLTARYGGAQPNISQTIIRTLELPHPGIPEQQKIAAVLWKLQRAIATQDRLIAATADLRQAAIHRLFTHGLNGEPLKNTEIGPMPESWHTSTLGAICGTNDGAIQTGPFGSQLHSREYQANGIPVVNPTHLLGNRVNHENVPRISEERAGELKRHKLEQGDILFARRGQIGRHGFIRAEESGWICGTGCFLVRVRNSEIINEYLPCYFSVPGVLSWLEANAAGAIMPNLNNTVLSRLPVYYPTQKEQHTIASTLATIDRKLAHHRAKRAALDDAFQSALHRLMTGAVRVADLDIDTSEVIDRQGKTHSPSFPRRREPSGIPAMDSRLRGNDE